MKFNVIVWDTNKKEFIPYNVIPYLVDCYNKNKNKPVTIPEFIKFVKDNSMYQWWGRCEYEIIISDWPSNQHSEKVDVHWQIMNNIDIVVHLLMKEVKVKK